MNDQDQEDTLPLQNVDQLAMGISTWFDDAHAQGKQLLNVPDGQPVTIDFNNGQGEQELILTGDMLKGFQAGIVAMTSIFGELPFSATTVNQDIPA